VLPPEPAKPPEVAIGAALPPSRTKRPIADCNESIGSHSEHRKKRSKNKKTKKDKKRKRETEKVNEKQKVKDKEKSRRRHD